MILSLFLVAALHDLAALEVDVSTATGRAVRIDRRLRLPQCGHPVIVTPSREATTVECTAPAWRIFVPDIRAENPRPVVARGDTITVTAGGPGFRVSIDAVAESAAATGERVRLRIPGSSARLVAVIAEDGSAVAAGYTSDLSGR